MVAMTDTPDLLTYGQRRVLRLAVRGCSDAEIAATLELSPGTVRMHLQNCKQRLGLTGDSRWLVRAAYALGMADADRK